ncbi:MAG TPA: endolytic transglycosylase MltG [Spirochaetia bacterium]|nr:endolytic transglycosylase MltG [Spirochaetia bacterium]
MSEGSEYTSAQQQPTPDSATPEKVRRRRPRAVITAITAIILIAAAGAAAAAYLNSPARSSATEVPFVVKKGETLDSIANRLADQHLIRSSLFLRLLGKFSGTGTDIQAGHYALKASMTTNAIQQTFVSGRQMLFRVTIPEGYTISQIADRLQNAGITTIADFTKAAKNPSILARFHIPAQDAQGFLFPDTYLFPKDYPANEVVGTMIENFFTRLKTVYPDYAQLTPKELLAKLTLASIVEREYVSPDEAPLIASVFYNRLRAHMRLESCATVVYVMTEQDGLPHPDRVYYKDLERPSPYNTYLHAGLPPGPISNPGITSLNAAFHPAKSDYWYFVLQSAGATHHRFSKSLAEHDRAAVYYLKTLDTHS